MARRRRRYGSAVTVDLGRYADLDRTVTTKDVLIGLGVGIGGAAAAAYGLKKARSMATPIAFLAPPVSGLDWIKTLSPIVGGAAAGYGAWTFQKRKNAQQAFGIAVGAAGAGLLIAIAYSPIAAQLGFAGIVGLDLPYGAYGLQIDDPLRPMAGYGGVIVDDSAMTQFQPAGYADRPNLGRLAAASLDASEDYSELGKLNAYSQYRGYAELFS